MHANNSGNIHMYHYRIEEYFKEETMKDILSFLGMIIVAIIGLVGVILQVKSKEKTESIDFKIDNLKRNLLKNR